MIKIIYWIRKKKVSFSTYAWMCCTGYDPPRGINSKWMKTLTEHWHFELNWHFAMNVNVNGNVWTVRRLLLDWCCSALYRPSIRRCQLSHFHVQISLWIIEIAMIFWFHIDYRFGSSSVHFNMFRIRNINRQLILFVIFYSISIEDIGIY